MSKLFADYPSLEMLAARIHEVWPEHDKYVAKSLDDRPPEVMAISDQIASCALKFAAQAGGGASGLCEDYRFLCEQIVMPEEMYFRRHNRYRLSSFADAERECYANKPLMTRYMNGLLVSNVIWRNHALAISSYALEFLPSLKKGSVLLEIGPGHGLFLYLAANTASVASAHGWDISPASVDRTRKILDLLEVARPVTLSLTDLFDAKSGKDGPLFDAIVMSEILEHLEAPVEALKLASAWLRPGGSIWVNVPANSPAPDHIFLVHSPEHARELVREAGLEVFASHAFPMTGSTLERARKEKLAISCVVIGRRNA